MMEAMKAKDKPRKEALSALLSALKNKAIDKREDLTEAEEGEVVLKEIKQLRDTLEQTPEDRTDIKDECNFRISVVISSYTKNSFTFTILKVSTTNKVSIFIDFLI